MKAMPGNLREQCLEIDLTCAPELIPGLERAYDRDPQSAFLFSDLARPYDRKIGWSYASFAYWKKPTLQTLTSAPVLIVFFVVATIYRLYVKAAVVLYLPLLLIDLPDRARLRERTSAGRKPDGVGSRTAIQSAVGGLALVGLLSLGGWPEIQAALESWLDDKLLAVWKAASLSELLPKGVLSLLLLQAAAYLTGFGSETMACWARADSGEKPPSAVARRWVSIAQGFYVAQVVLVVALIVGIFTALAPNAILILGHLWRFLI